MGKASRTRRDRQDPTPASRGGSVGRGDARKGPPVFWIVIGAMIAAGIAVLVMTAPGSSEKQAVAGTGDQPAFGDVTVSGGELPRWSGRSIDDAAGEVVPTIQGIDFDEIRRTIPATDKPSVIVVLAHWCPHCQVEVPRIVDWATEQEASELDQVEFVGLSTAAGESQPNFPPSTWLAREKWPFKTMVDDEAGTAADALGVEGFPFIVFVNADGTVSERYSGEMPIAAFDKAVAKIRAK